MKHVQGNDSHLKFGVEFPNICKEIRFCNYVCHFSDKRKGRGKVNKCQ